MCTPSSEHGRFARPSVPGGMCSSVALLRDARRGAGLSQGEVAERLGRKQPFVSKYESGFFGVEVVEFFQIMIVTQCSSTEMRRIVEIIKRIANDKLEVSRMSRAKMKNRTT